MKKEIVNPVVCWSLTVSKIEKKGLLPALDLPSPDHLRGILDGITDDFVFAYEQGDKLGKEHIQCFIKLTKRLRTGHQLISLFQTAGLDPKFVSQYQFSKAFSPDQLRGYAAKTGRDGNKVYEKSDFHSAILLSEHTSDLNPNQILIDEAVEQSFTQDRKITYVSDVTSGLGKTTMMKRYALGMHAAGRVGFKAYVVPDSSIQSVGLFIARQIKDGLSLNPNQKFLFVFNFTFSDSRYKDIAPWYGVMETVMDGFVTTSFQGKCIIAHARKCSTQVLVLSNRMPNNSFMGVERINNINIVP
jgi:hypothetical protein